MMGQNEIMLRNQIAAEYSQNCKSRRFWSLLTKYGLIASSSLFIMSIAAALYVSF